MRVITERVRRGPPHSLTCREVKAVVRTVECALRRLPGLLVHLKLTLPENGTYERPVIYSPVGNRLNIPCRGLPRDVAIKELLRELVLLCGAEDRIYYHQQRLSAQELKSLDSRVNELLPKVLEALDEGTA